MGLQQTISDLELGRDKLGPTLVAHTSRPFVGRREPFVISIGGPGFEAAYEFSLDDLQDLAEWANASLKDAKAKAEVAA